MIDESMDTEQMKQPVKPDEFRAKPAWQRFLVMIAGMVMNVILAVAIYIGICYTWGDTYLSNEDVKWGYNFNEAGHLLGFHDGDRLVSIDGEEADDINKVVNSLIITESDRSVVVERNGRQVELILPLDELISMRQQKGYENFLLPRIPFLIDSVVNPTVAQLRKGDEIVAIDNCGEWNTFAEEIIARESGSVPAVAAGPLPAAKPQRVRDIRESEHVRLDLGNAEVNRVLGGGMVPGSLVLVGGEPGIGKSTLSLQIALAANGLKTLYVSGEESAEQIKMRAARIGIGNDECLIYPETLLENIVAQIAEHRPDLVVIDSIQTIYTDLVESSAGSVSQIRECAATLLKYAKGSGTSIFIIGHITKDGAIAGPKILEHIVDVVLQFEGDSNNIYRILRGIKNRFGATFEIGVFEMLDAGLRGVDNPSEILLTHYEEPLSGIAVGASADGVRPYLIEVQALVSGAAYGTPQRSTTGYDARRMNMLLAVLEKRVGMKMFTKDVFLNFAGGFKVADPGLDLAVVAAVISSYYDRPIGEGICCAGEVGLSGEVRPAPRTEQRISEAARLGFRRIVVSGYLPKGAKRPKGIEVVAINTEQRSSSALRYSNQRR